MSKRALVKNGVNRVRSSYWFLPSVLAILAVGLSAITLTIDRNPSSVLYIWPDGWATTQVDGARNVLSVIAQSILGVVGVMFSVTIVAVSFASGNFGPRLIGNFMRDRGTQWCMGILIATFVYALLVLRAVHGAQGGENPDFEAFVPHMSLGMAMGLTGLSIAGVIFYVHHIPEIINVSNISADLGHRLRDALRELIDDRADADDPNISFPDRDADDALALHQMGYIQTYDEEALHTIAEEKGVYLRICYNVGTYVSHATQAIQIWQDEPLDDETKDAMRGCFVIGHHPTEDQNLLFILQQLVEMIARALSPGVNDPYTAIDCLNWMYAGFSEAANYRDGLGEPPVSRVQYKELTYGDLVKAGFTKSLPYVTTDTLATRHLRRLLDRLLDEVQREDETEVIKAVLADLERARQANT